MGGNAAHRGVSNMSDAAGGEGRGKKVAGINWMMTHGIPGWLPIQAFLQIALSAPPARYKSSSNNNSSIVGFVYKVCWLLGL